MNKDNQIRLISVILIFIIILIGFLISIIFRDYSLTEFYFKIMFLPYILFGFLLFFPSEGKQCEFCNNKAEEHYHYTIPYKFSKFWYVCKKCHGRITPGGKDVFLESQRWN